MAALSSPTLALRAGSWLGLSLLLGCTAGPADDGDGYAGAYDDTASETEDPPYTGPLFTVGTFNIKDLRDYTKSRNAVDLGMIAQLINELSPTVMGLQEIDGAGALELLTDYGLDPRYDWAVNSEGGTLNTAILYDSEQVSLSGRRDVNISPPGFRDLNVAELTLEETGESFVFGVVHLASEYDSDNTQTRADEVLALQDYFTGDVASDYGDSADRFVIVGDFNDTFAGVDDKIDTLQPLEDDPAFTFATENAVTYTFINSRSKIDHIVLSEAMVDLWPGRDDEEHGCEVFAHDGIAPYSNYSGGYEDTQNISDHRPVLVDLAVEGW